MGRFAPVPQLKGAPKGVIKTNYLERFFRAPELKVARAPEFLGEALNLAHDMLNVYTLFLISCTRVI